ncbi:MAG TPA: branched-chain-amino-acid transaminase [Candidatus Polarisedimenticolia bacterium]|nr:branched-chain-amino-acid transaminase [Candidatus Polarisedimenticolia bacterium]
MPDNLSRSVRRSERTADPAPRPAQGVSIFLNGEYVDSRDKALVPLHDHGLLYGDGVFEGIRAYNGRIFRMQDHMDRLYHSARAIMLEIPYSKDELGKILLETVRRAGLDEAYIRLVVSRGPGDLGIDPRKCPRPAVYIIAGAIALYPKEKYTKGLRCTIAATRRNRPDCLNPQVKTLNYLNNILAKIEAIQSGVDEAIMLNEAGYVAEGAADNIWVVQEGTLCTPPTHVGILEGITRKVLMEICEEQRIPCREKNMVVHDLIKAEEIFLCGTGAELIPVVEIDGRVIGEGTPGPWFERMLALFRARTQFDGVPFR